MDEGKRSSLADALHRYVDARTAALIRARRILRINELDARAILYISTHPATRPGALAEFLGITSAGVTVLVDRLIDRGAVLREVDASDRRVNRLSVIVDLADEPWAELTRFDVAFDTAADESDVADSDEFAAALDRLTRSAAAASA